MATIINTDKKEVKTNASNKKENRKKAPLFRKMNYILMGIGVLFLLIGFVFLAGGKAPSDEVYNPEIFNTTRLVIAPTLILAGLIVEIFAIMYYPKSTKSEEVTEN